MSQIKLQIGAAPSTPPSGYAAIYAKTDGQLYSKDDAGVETPLGFASSAFLNALGNLSGTGIIVKSSGTAAVVRSLQVGTGLSVTNGDGVAGDPLVQLADSGVTANTYGSTSQVAQVTVNAKGQVTAATNVAIAIPSSNVSDFTEAAQDAVGAALTDTLSVDLTYNDAGNSITATVLPAGVDHNSLQNYVANQHVDHSAVSISAGAGLTGGGDLTANRVISMPDVGTPSTYGSVSQVPVFTTDAKGRISAVTPMAIAISTSAVSAAAAPSEAYMPIQSGDSIQTVINKLVYSGTLVYNTISASLTVPADTTWLRGFTRITGPTNVRLIGTARLKVT